MCTNINSLLKLIINTNIYYLLIVIPSELPLEVVGSTDSTRSIIGGFGNIFVDSIFIWSLYCSVEDNFGDAIIN